MIDIGICSGTSYNDGGALTCQVALHGVGSTCTPGLAYSPFGFKGRPRSPVTDSAGNVQDGALVLYWYEGSTLHTLPLDDGRRSTKLPPLDEGGAVFYADVDGAYDLWDGQGNRTIKLPTGKTVTIDVGGGISVVASSSGVKIQGVNATAPMLVGNTAATPANAVLCGTSYQTSVPSTVLFAATA